MTERGEEWERLRHELFEVVKVHLFARPVEVEIVRRFSLTQEQAIGLDGCKGIDAATDYLWSLGVRA